MHAVGCRANLRLPFVKFREHVMMPYGDMVRNVRQDEQFLLNENYSEAPSNGVVEVLKSVWRDMPPGDKACVLDHLELVVAVYDRISEAGGF
jgi:hypothetical protein